MHAPSYSEVIFCPGIKYSSNSGSPAFHLYINNIRRSGNVCVIHCIQNIRSLLSNIDAASQLLGNTNIVFLHSTSRVDAALYVSGSLCSCLIGDFSL